MAPKNTPRFARIVAQAFDALGVTQTVFHEELGGPSDTTLRKIMEGKPVGVSVRTLNALDKAFGWDPGDAARTLAGGNPTPIRSIRDDPKSPPIPGEMRLWLIQLAVEADALGMMTYPEDEGMDPGMRNIKAYLRDADRLAANIASVALTAAGGDPAQLDELKRQVKMGRLDDAFERTRGLDLVETKGEDNDMEVAAPPGTSPEAGQTEEVSANKGEDGVVGDPLGGLTEHPVVDSGKDDDDPQDLRRGHV